MGKKVLVLSTSLRKNANSDALAEAFLKGAKDAGHDVEKVSLIDKKIAFCRGCLACQTTGQCVMDDDANAIMEKMCAAQVIAFATPIYYYEMSGQMKTMLDRANALYALDYQFRDIYFLAAAAEDGDYVWSRAASGLEGWIDCFEKAHLSGVIFAGGVSKTGEVEGHAALQKAYAAGKAL